MQFQKKKNQESGQASLLMALMIFTFLLFFVFVVNTGMLVNAKINLQNAADTAAYSGAAVQARQLNAISFLNYEMRRQYKKFLFRYYVLGNMAQDSHGKNTSSGLRLWSPNNNPNDDFQVPSVCVIFNEEDNYCRVWSLPAIQAPPSNPLNQISVVLEQQLKELEILRQGNCDQIGQTNQLLLSLWLYNTDPNLEGLEQSVQARLGERGRRIFNTMKGLSQGVGLIPKEILLYKRIQSLEEFLNFPAQQGVGTDEVSDLQRRQDRFRHERPIQAFLSALNTLGGSREEATQNKYTFGDLDQIRMTELMPRGGAEERRILKLDPLEIDFETYWVDFPRDGNNNPQSSNNARDCRSRNEFLRVRKLPIGVVKDPTILTYYAVQLEAQANILFSPFGPMTLRAYSAAYPFGSRIGPQISPGEAQSLFVRKATTRRDKMNPTQYPCSDCAGIPNLPLKDEEDTADLGWNLVEAQNFFFNALRENDGSLPKTLDPQDLNRAYQIAMAPNPWEKGKYNIINDLPFESQSDENHENSGDPFVRYFDEEPGDYKGTHALYAPISPRDQSDDEAAQELESLLERSITDATLREAFQNALNVYLDRMKSTTGEGGEGFHVYRFFDPFRYPNGSGDKSQQPIEGGRDGFLMTQAQDVRSSWSDFKAMNPDLANAAERGRTGYSVKFISFETLRRGVLGSMTWNNLLDPDGIAGVETKKLEH